MADYKPQDLPLEVSKTIYAKRKSYDFKKDDLIKVLQMEITYHLNKYRDLKFKSIDDPIKGEDRSMTYIIRFELKKEHEKETNTNTNKD